MRVIIVHGAGVGDEVKVCTGRIDGGNTRSVCIHSPLMQLHCKTPDYNPI